MDFFVELIGELLIDGAVEGSSSGRVPRLIRKILAISIVLVYLALTFLFVYLCISATDIIEKFVFGGVAALDIWFIGNLFKKLKERSKK